jgi:hypothetical protein
VITVKQGDTHDVVWTVNANLTGATVRLLARKDETVELDSVVTDAASGEVTHTLTGTLPLGLYEVELEVTLDDVVTTFPNYGYDQLLVVRDL